MKSLYERESVHLEASLANFVRIQEYSEQDRRYIYIERNIKARSRNICYGGKEMSNKYYENVVFVAYLP